MYTFHKKDHSCPQTVLALEIKMEKSHNSRKNLTSLNNFEQQRVKNGNLGYYSFMVFTKIFHLSFTLVGYQQNRGKSPRERNFNL
jgi:hypothetical protein